MLANALVGNRLDAPMLETSLTELRLRATGNLVVSVTGAASGVYVDDLPATLAQPFSLRAGQTLRVGAPAKGLRSYVAVHGSIEAASFLGSVAPDPFIGFGRQLQEGDVVHTHDATTPLEHPQFGTAVIRPWAVAAHGGRPLSTGASVVAAADHHVVVDVTPGPDSAMFGTTRRRLFEDDYVVTPNSNAMGIRMSGATPVRTKQGEILSTGVPPGAVEVPGNGELIVLHRARGITAGYAIPAVVTTQGLDVLAQVRPGARVRFRAVESDEAIKSLRAERQALEATTMRAVAILAGHSVNASAASGWA